MNVNKSLEELENDFWESTSNFPTALVKRIFYLRKQKLKDFDSDDIRILISQSVGLTYIIPLALKKLKENILEEALYYPGDLLLAVLNVSQNYWPKNMAQCQEFVGSLKKSKNQIESGLEDIEIKSEATKLILEIFMITSN